jgi:hypothetical protein
MTGRLLILQPAGFFIGLVVDVPGMNRLHDCGTFARIKE